MERDSCTEYEPKRAMEQKNKKKDDSVQFDEALRQLIKVGHIEQGRGKKLPSKKTTPKTEKRG